MKIKLQHVNYSYHQNLPQQLDVLKDINLEITSGEFIGIVGATGSGKTTLLQHFTGLLRPILGSVLVDDRDIWKKDYPLNVLRRKIGLVFQFPESQLFEETVFLDVAFGPKSLKLTEEEIANRVQLALNLVGLDAENIKNRSPHNLSDGEKRRVALAGILAMAPEILILDEPTAGLDPSGVSLISKILKQLHDEGTTIVLISHNMELIFELTKRVIIMDRGAIVFDGDKGSVIARMFQPGKTKLELPRTLRLSYYLNKLNIIPEWKIFSRTELEYMLREN